MRNHIFNRIREEIRSETPNINLKPLLEQARIEEAPSLPRPKIFFRWQLIAIPVMIIALVLILIPMNKSKGDFDQSGNDELYIRPALSLITLLDTEEIVNEDSDELTVAIGKDVEFLNRFLDCSAFLLSDEPILDDYSINFSTVPDTSEGSWDSENLSHFPISITIKQGDKNYLIEGYETDSYIILHLNVDDLKYMITVDIRTQISRIRIYQDTQIIYDAQIEVDGEVLVLKNMVNENPVATYQIQTNEQGFQAIDYQAGWSVLDSPKDEGDQTPESSSRSGEILVKERGYSVITNWGNFDYQTK